MKSAPSILAALFFATALGITGCGPETTPPVAETPATTPSAAGTTAAPGIPEAPEADDPGPMDEQTPAQRPETTPAPADEPDGSGHGLCFDPNSGLAASAVDSLDAPPAGDMWVIQAASEDSIADGCTGVLSWLTVEWPGIHPGTHVLFFADGDYLGTASAEPYAYTHVAGKTRNTVSVEYRWPLPDDALCCPQGGPSVVTFTLDGNTVEADGQFPPGN